MIGKISVKCGLVNAYSFCENKKIGCDPPGVCVLISRSRNKNLVQIERWMPMQSKCFRNIKHPIMYFKGYCKYNRASQVASNYNSIRVLIGSYIIHCTFLRRTLTSYVYYGIIHLYQSIALLEKYILEIALFWKVRSFKQYLRS